MLGVHVHVARIPAAPPAPAWCCSARPVLVGERRVLRQLDLDPPAHLAVGVAVGLCHHTADAELGRPFAGEDRPGRNPRVVVPGRVRGRAIYSVSVENPWGETVTSGWLDPPHPRNCLRPQVRAVGRACHRPRSTCGGEGPIGPGPSILDAHGRGLRHLEGHHDEAPLEIGRELAGDHLARIDRCPGAGRRPERGRSRGRADRMPPGRRMGARAPWRRSRTRSVPSAFPAPGPPKSPDPTPPGSPRNGATGCNCFDVRELKWT